MFEGTATSGCQVEELRSALAQQIARHVIALDGLDQLDLEIRFRKANDAGTPLSRLMLLSQLAADLTLPPIDTDPDADIPAQIHHLADVDIHQISPVPNPGPTVANTGIEGKPAPEPCKRAHPLPTSLVLNPITQPPTSTNPTSKVRRHCPRDHLTETQANDLINAALFSAAPGVDQPLNTALCIIYNQVGGVPDTASATDVERDNAIMKARQVIKKALRDTLSRISNAPATGLYCEEQARHGGQGLHQHGLWHLPEANYEIHLRTLLSVLAGKFKARLKYLCIMNSVTISTRTTPIKMFDALLVLKERAKLAELKAKHAVRRGEPYAVQRLEAANKAHQALSLPFYVSTPTGRQNKPLSLMHVIEIQIPYILKSLLQSLPVSNANNDPCTLGDLSRAKGGDVTLQRQAANRPPRTVSISSNINAAAQAKAGWIAPKVPLVHYLSPSIRKARIGKDTDYIKPIVESTIPILGKIGYNSVTTKGLVSHGSVQASHYASPGRKRLFLYSRAGLPRLHHGQQGQGHTLLKLQRRTCRRTWTLQVGSKRCTGTWSRQQAMARCMGTR